MKGYEVDVGGDDLDSFGAGALQGGINTGAVNCAAIADESHGLLAFGTSIGTVEFWDARSRNRASILGAPVATSESEVDGRPEITALSFHQSGLNLATGNSRGVVRTYDLRSPVPLLEKNQGYDYPIQTLRYLDSPLSSGKLLSADKKGIKIWEAESGNYWTGVEPAVDLNHVEWVPDSGMLLTANEGRQQHAFFIPQLGPAPKWCAFLDNLVEEMAEDADDPNAFKSSATGAGEVYDNYKFLDMQQLRELSLDHLIGTTNLLRPYMHGYFVAHRLYEQARLLANPDMAEQQRQKSIQEKIDKERESRIRGTKKVAVKVNRKYAEKLAAQEEAHERKKAQRVLRLGGDEPQTKPTSSTEEGATKSTKPLVDNRFANLFEDDDYEIDETSREFAMHNPSTVTSAQEPGSKKRGLTAVEEEELSSTHNSSSEDEEAAPILRDRTDLERETKGRIGASSYKKSGQKRQDPKMRVSSSVDKPQRRGTGAMRSFGDLKTTLPGREKREQSSRSFDLPRGEKEVSFVPASGGKRGGRGGGRGGGGRGEFGAGGADGDGRREKRGKDRRSASGNAFRRQGV